MSRGEKGNLTRRQNTHAHAHMVSRQHRLKAERKTRTHTHTPVQRNPTPCQSERGREFAPGLLCSLPLVCAHACSALPSLLCCRLCSQGSGLFSDWLAFPRWKRICVFPHQQRLRFDKFCFPCCREVTAATGGSCIGMPPVRCSLPARVHLHSSRSVFPDICKVDGVYMHVTSRAHSHRIIQSAG